MASLKDIAIVIVAWIAISIGIYITMNPIKNGVVQEETFKTFTSYELILGIIMLIVLYLTLTARSTGAYIISPFQALSELTDSERAKLKITDINEMTIIDIHPKDNGKKALIRYLIPFGRYKGNVAHIILNCMSDMRYSATDIPSQTRIVGVSMEPISYNSANANLKSTEKTSMDKLLKLTKEVRKVGEKGGETAQELISDIAEKEDKRYEGED